MPPLKTGILTGVTASGKTGISIEIALELKKEGIEIEIINADSLLVYRGMDIGTAKPTLNERQGIVHHLIDVRNPDQPFNAGDFTREVEDCLAKIHAAGKRALIVGGTGFYLKALLFGLWNETGTDLKLRERLETESSEALLEKLAKADPKSAVRIGVGDRYRLIRALEVIELSGKTPTELEEARPETSDPRFQTWILTREEEELQTRIALRTREMIKQGLVSEVRSISKNYPGAQALKSVGYAQTLRFLSGEKPQGRKIKPGEEGLIEEIELATRQLVKKQKTWFRGQIPAQWITLESERAALLRDLKNLYLT